MGHSGVIDFVGKIKRSLFYAALLVIWDAVLHATYTMSLIFCPVWLLVSLVKCAIKRPGWGVSLARVAIPVLTLGVVVANAYVQIAVAERNVRRVIAACEAFHADRGRFPETLPELVPKYLEAVPVAKHGFGPWCDFKYFRDPYTLYWTVTPPHGRKIYNFKTRSWSYLD